MFWIGLYCGGFLATGWLTFWGIMAAEREPGFGTVCLVLLTAVGLAAMWPVSIPLYPLWFRR